MENKYIYSTSDISQFYDLTPKGLAYYEEQGIIHPKRKEDSSYRIFTLEDCYSLYHSKLYKNNGLSLKEMVNIEKSGSLDEIVETLNTSANEELRRIAIEKRIQEKVLEITHELTEYQRNGQSFEVVIREEFYRLFVRTFDARHITNKKSSNEFAQWNKYIPISTASLLYTKEKLLSDDKEMNVNIANVISAKDLEFLALEKTSHVTRFEPCKCIKTIIHGNASDIDSKVWLEDTLCYINQQGYTLDGDVLTSMLLVTGEKDHKTRYDIAWFPIK